MTKNKKEDKYLAINKDAYKSFFLLETYEAGMVLLGTEVKSIKEGKVTLKESYAFVKDGQVFVKNLHIKPYEHGSINNHEPLRLKKLLLHKNEIERLDSKIKDGGHTLVITKLYLSKNFIKAELSLAKGKTTRDRREDIKSREAKRDMERAMKKRQQ